MVKGDVNMKFQELNNNSQNNSYNMGNAYKYEDKIDQLNRNDAFNSQLTQAFMVAQTFLTQSYLNRFTNAPIMNNNDKDYSKLKFIRLTRVVFDPTEEKRDKLVSVYSALNTIESTVALVIAGKGNTVDFYFAVRSERSAQHAVDVLNKALSSNFPGTQFSSVGMTSKEKEQVFIPQNKKYTDFHLAAVSLIPSERDDDKEKFVQGIEKFIDGMNGEKYTAIFLASPVKKDVLEERKQGFESLSSNLSSHSKISVTYGHNESLAVNESLSDNFSSSVNESIGSTSGTSESTSSGMSTNSSSGFNFGGGSSSDGSSSNWGFSTNNSTGFSENYTSGTSFSKSITKATTETKGVTVTEGSSVTEGTSDTVALNFENKAVLNLMEKADAELKRIEKGFAYGAYDIACYFYSEDYATVMTAASICKALFTGETSDVESTHINVWDKEIQSNKIAKIMENICYLKHPIAEIPEYGNFDKQYVTPTNMVTVNEMPIMFALPKKSVNGVAVVEMAEFGREVVFENPPESTIDFGRIYHMGKIDGVSLEKQDNENYGIRVPFDFDLFSSHCFITGSSGSGKSHATYRLLGELLDKEIKMMVVEPAKGEYKQMFGGRKDITVYNTDPKVYNFLRINPFEFPPSTHISVHMTKLLNIFKSSWELTAAMPNILESAVQQVYVKCGWDIKNSVYIPGISKNKFPTFKDVIDILPSLIDDSDYSDENKGNYKGSLITRVKSMTTGLVGMIFENNEGIKDEVLFDSNVIVDLSEIGSEDTVSLIMGVIVMKLKEYREHQRKIRTDGETHDSKFNHVVVLEEAHNLLKRKSGDGGSSLVEAAVKSISNSIKEMRTYGEGFLIIDQSPIALDISAIENTSTKIIFNTPGKDACDELGSALALNEFQTKELSRLARGVAAVFQKGWLSPVLMKVDRHLKKDYSTELQKQSMLGIQAVRGTLLYEIYRQTQTKKYERYILLKLISDYDESLPANKNRFDEKRLRAELEKANPNMPQYEIDNRLKIALQKKIVHERAEEFKLMISTYLKSSYIENASENCERLGECFINIAGCEELFSILADCEELKEHILKIDFYLKKYYIEYKSNDSKKDKTKQNYIKEQSLLYNKWFSLFKTALSSYIYIEKPDDNFFETIALWMNTYYLKVCKSEKNKDFYNLIKLEQEK